jgi:hypothetical protein
MNEVVHREQWLMLVFHRQSKEKKERISKCMIIDRTLSSFACSLFINLQ